MKNFFLDSFAKTINAYLALDPESKHRLQILQNKIVTIDLLPFHFIFQCEFATDGVKCYGDELLTAETKLTGTPLQLFGMFISKNNRQHFFADDLKIDGNAELGQQVIFLFDHLKIDWEEYLSYVTGDVPAYHISQFLRNTKSWLQKTEQNISDNVTDYIQEEKNWLPPREALEDFYQGIDELRLDLDRIEIKIKNLANEINEGDKE